MGIGIDTESRTLAEVLHRRATASPDTTAYTFLRDGEDDAAHLTYGVLDRRAHCVADALRRHGSAGARVLLVYPPGCEFIEAFFGCLYAGMTAVPVLPPDPFTPGPAAARIAAVAADAEVACLASASALAPVAGALGRSAPLLGERAWVFTDRVRAEESGAPPALAAGAPDDLALLQYTSGSTGRPKGVMLTHANLLAHGRACHRTLGLSADEVVVSWLPLHHDMGLVGTILYPLQVGCRSIQMSPAAFLQRPYRWLRAISRYRATLSVAPNFGYELCCRKVSADEIATLDLRAWSAALNGSERVRGDTIQRFAETFAPAGFRRAALMPCYGLAEASLMVSVAERAQGWRSVALRPAALECGHAEPAAGGERATVLVSAGPVVDAARVRIVEPDSRMPCAPGKLGEIWVAGPAVGRGYWRRSEETAEVFAAHVADGDPTAYLRTGDLGFFDDGELVVVGRLKDLIILRGVNHVPEDIEHSAGAGAADLRPGGGAAFAVDGREGERLVLVHEVRSADVDTAAVLSAVGAAITAAHGVRAAAIVLVRPRSLPKTSSGKVRRRECRERFANGTLDVVAEWRESGWQAGVPASHPERARSDARGNGGHDDRRAERAARIERWLIARVAELRDLSGETIDVGAPLSSYGMDSAEAAILAVDLEDWLGTELPAELVWSRPTIALLADALVDAAPAAETDRDDRQGAGAEQGPLG